MALEYTTLLKETSILASGKTISLMAKEFFVLKMEKGKK
jgi:hypothetical protein